MVKDLWEDGAKNEFIEIKLVGNKQFFLVEYYLGGIRGY